MHNITNENSTILPSVDNEVAYSDLFYRSLFEYNPSIVLFMDIQGIIAKPNDEFSEVLGYSNGEIVLSSLERFLPSDEIPKYRELFNKVLYGETQKINTKLLHKTGKYLYFSIVGLPATFGGKIIGVFVIAIDITGFKETEYELDQVELKFRSVVEEAFIGVYIIGQDGQIVYGNPKFYQILGTEFREGLNIREFIHPEDHPIQKSILDNLIGGGDGVDHSFRIIRENGTLIDIEAHSKKVYFQNNRPRVVGTLQDITERKKSEDRIKYLAYYDSLTDLPNRMFFNTKLERELVNSKMLHQKLAVMILDLDRFKYINDTLGHRVGDKLLKQVSLRLKSVLEDNQDTLARLGGDGFIILSLNIPNTNGVMELAKRLIELLEKPFHVEEYELFITASLGISIFPIDGVDSETIIKHADSALHKAKDKGRNNFQIFTSSMNAEAYKIFTLESDLRKALQLNQFELYYQPKICAINHEILGAEALIRWNHPKFGVVTPDEFIPLAEETGIIHEIGKWVKETACFQNKEWQDSGLQAIPISINLSASRFLEKDLISNIVEILAKTELGPEYLEIEITETSLLENEKVVFSALDELNSIGIKVSLDDFGTGYSSLSYLKRFKGRIDTLKIDRTFINDLSLSDPDDSNFITKSIIEIAQHLKMNVVAEGVETLEQLEILRAYKCNTIQGYLFSKPVPAHELSLLLRKGKIETPPVFNAD